MKTKFLFVLLGFTSFFIFGGVAHDKGQWYFVILGVFAYVGLIVGVISLMSLLLGLFKK